MYYFERNPNRNELVHKMADQMLTAPVLTAFLYHETHNDSCRPTDAITARTSDKDRDNNLSLSQCNSVTVRLFTFFISSGWPYFRRICS